MEEKVLRTPLYDCHVAAGGKMVPFAGYALPVQYEQSGVIAEHMAVRQKAGLFDVSHMGEVVLSGPDALANVQKLMTNDYSDLADGFVRYSPMCYENGGVVDDLLVYKIKDGVYFIVVNAANRHKDVAWMRQNLSGDVELKDISDDVAQIALQGPGGGRRFSANSRRRRTSRPRTIPLWKKRRWRGKIAWFPGPATQEKMGSSCIPHRRMPLRSGMPCWKQARNMG